MPGERGLVGWSRLYAACVGRVDAERLQEEGYYFEHCANLLPRKGLEEPVLNCMNFPAYAKVSHSLRIDPRIPQRRRRRRKRHSINACLISYMKARDAPLGQYRTGQTGIWAIVPHFPSPTATNGPDSSPSAHQTNPTAQNGLTGRSGDLN